MSCWTVLGASLLFPLASIGSSLGRIEHIGVPRGISAGPRYAAPAHRAGVAATPPTAAWPRPHVSAPLSRLGAWPLTSLTFVGAWLAVATIRLSLLAAGLVAIARIKRIAEPLDDHIARKLRRVRYAARFGRVAAIRVSSDIDVPVAIGFRRPAIVFPRAVIERESIADLDQIAMHEYAHLERYDDWGNLAQRAIEAVLWYHPVVAFVGRAIALEREIACDDYVVARTGRAHRYAACLWKLVESSGLPARPLVAPGALLSPKAITVRIEALLDSRRNALPRLSPPGAIGLGLFCIFIAIVEAQRAPVIAIEDRTDRATPAVPIASRSMLSATPSAIPRATPSAIPAAKPTPAPRIAASFHARRKTFVIRVAEAAAPQELANAIAREVSRADRTVSTATLERAHPSRREIERCIGCSLRGADLHGLDLHGLTLTGADLRGADLRGANLAGTAFFGADLRDANLRDADLHDASFSGCDLRRASLDRANLQGTRMTGTSFGGTNLHDTQIRSLVDRCSGCDFRGLDLRGQDLHDIVLEAADLRNADLRGANLAGARLRGVDLSGVRVDGADLHDSVFDDCTLGGVALRNANTMGARFETSDIGVAARYIGSDVQDSLRKAAIALRTMRAVASVPPLEARALRHAQALRDASVLRDLQALRALSPPAAPNAMDEATP